MHVYSISTIVVLMAGLVTSAALPPPVEPKIAAGNVTSAALPAEPKITAPIIKNLIATNQVAACGYPKNSKKKEGDSCKYLSGVSGEDDVIKGHCFPGPNTGDNLVCFA